MKESQASLAFSRTKDSSRQCSGATTRSLANKVGSIVDAAAALITGSLRIGTQRPGAINLPIGFMGSNDPIRRFPLFDPLFQHANLVEAIGPLSSRAVTHARQHDEADRVATGLHRLQVKVHARTRSHLLVRPPVIDEQFSVLRKCS